MAGAEYEVDGIIGRRITSRGKEDFLVRWQNYSPLLSTWEPIDNFSTCQQAILEYFDQHWPIPGSQATSVVHLTETSTAMKTKRDLVTLQALPAKRRRKILRGVRKDLKEEILRHQVQEAPAQNVMGKWNGYIARDHTRSLQDKTIESGNKNGQLFQRKLNEIMEIEDNSHEPCVLQYSQTKKSLRSKTNHIHSQRQRSKKNGIILSPQKNGIVNNVQASATLPSRLTRQNLPSCSSQCVLEEELVVTNSNGCLHIKMCNEAKKNVISRQMCEDMVSALQRANKNDVSVVVISGSGDTFSYGWDLDGFDGGLALSQRKELLQKYRLLTRMLIMCPKPLIAAVNGDVAGFGVSIVALCDFVFAAEEASFQTKFTEWGHPPVGCCSCTLPHLFGPAKAMSMILMNTEVSASAGKEYGLVTEILSTENFEIDLKKNVDKLLTVPLQCLQDTKTLLHEDKVQQLENANHEESDFFLNYITNDEALKSILARWRSSLEV